MNKTFLQFALLSDTVIKDEFTNKLSLIGLFDKIYDKKLPITIDKMNVLSRWSNISDKVEHEQRFKIVREEDGKEIFDSKKFERKFILTNEKNNHTVIIVIRDLRFEKTGYYKIMFFLDEKIQPQELYFTVNLIKN